jgi:hypothetical protein
MQRETEAGSAEHGRPPIEITVDGKAITLDDPETTPNEILRLADYEPGDTDFHDMRLLSDRLGIRARPPYSAL